MSVSTAAGSLKQPLMDRAESVQRIRSNEAVLVRALDCQVGHVPESLSKVGVDLCHDDPRFGSLTSSKEAHSSPLHRRRGTERRAECEQQHCLAGLCRGPIPKALCDSATKSRTFSSGCRLARGRSNPAEAPRDKDPAGSGQSGYHGTYRTSYARTDRPIRRSLRPSKALQHEGLAVREES